MTQTPDFDALYRADRDPWRVRSSFYERRKLEIVLASLSSESYAAAWDPACGVGELVARLRSRADRVLATDASPEAVALTRERCGDLFGVRLGAQALPAPPPADFGAPTLVVLSEFVYYLDAEARQASLEMLDRQCAPEAEIVSLHWRHKPGDAWLSGSDVQSEIDHTLTGRGWHRRVRHDDADFSLASHRRQP